MSWFKIFSAVVVGNIIFWVVIGSIRLFLSFIVIDELLGRRRLLEDPTSSAFQKRSTRLNVSPGDSLAGQAAQERQRLENSRQEQAHERSDPNMIRTNRQVCEFWTEEFKSDCAA